MRSGLLLTVLTMLPSVALAAEPPKILGHWVPVQFVSATLGTSDALPASTKPVFTTDPAKGWSYDFDSQDGAAFSGKSKGPSGKSRYVVGAFRQDGKSFVMSTTNGNAAGEMEGDRIELCWTDNIPDFIGASCTVYKRQ